MRRTHVPSSVVATWPVVGDVVTTDRGVHDALPEAARAAHDPRPSSTTAATAKATNRPPGTVRGATRRPNRRCCSAASSRRPW
ncbi:Uncharacterised protein [Mycobacteroides abscessus]|nr:Uncharacterised protein [Mycobacteroides abscessus]